MVIGVIKLNKVADLTKIFGSRQALEGAVIFCAYHNLDLLNEYKLREDDFKTEEGKLLFTIGKILNNKGINIIDRTTLSIELTHYPELNERLNEYGGIKTVIEQMKYVDTVNADIYVDNLFKTNYLLALGEKGFNPILNDDYVKKIRQMNYEQLQNFIEYTLLLTDNERGMTMRGVEVTELYITDEARERYFNGESVETFTFSETSPLLNSITHGLPLGATTQISSPSGGSKSTFITYNFVFPIINRNEKVVLITNEMTYKQYEAMLITIVARKVFNEFGLTRNKLMNGVTEEKDRVVFDKVMNYINTKLAKKLKVVFYSSGKTEVPIKVIKKESKLGCRLAIYDVMKVEDSRGQAWQELIELSKKLDSCCKECNVALIAVNQLTQTSLGKRTPTRADLSEGKDVIKVISNHIILRWLNSNEFTGEEYDAHFYTLQKNELGKWQRRKFELKKEDNLGHKFLVAYVDKNRYGEDGQFVVYRFDGHYATFKELCFCQPVPDFKK